MIAAVDSPYGFIFITQDEKGLRRLHIDTIMITQSVYDPSSSLLDSHYYYNYFAVLPTMLEDPQSVLILGHAGGTFTRLFNAYYPELEITGVELDPEVSALSKAYMGLDSAKLDLFHSDARAFLLQSSQRYDLILVDAYHGASIPAHLATREFFELCAEHLNEGGLLAVNVASGESEFLTVFENTLAHPFGEVFSAPIPGSFNTLLLTGKEARYEPVQNLDPALQEKWRGLQREGPEVRAHDSEAPLFEDDKLSQVELLNEAMLMQLLEGF
ncbi:fused MFS/spermidine synthase [Candidatus Peregrinibacteria bacterium]|nr:MAG: fused MFS/spermidine synthase [Candidatus Peregrinibacteria bacterium]